MKKKVYEPVKVMVCNRCRQRTTHTLIDYQWKTYRCNICGTYKFTSKQ